MKALLGFLVGFCLAACSAMGGAEPRPGSFVIGKQQFKAGDSIVIDQVLATSPHVEVGTSLVVRGHYALARAAKARIGLHVTHRSPAAVDASARPPVDHLGAS